MILHDQNPEYYINKKNEIETIFKIEFDDLRKIKNNYNAKIMVLNVHEKFLGYDHINNLDYSNKELIKIFSGMKNDIEEMKKKLSKYEKKYPKIEESINE